jgi:4a-hydroxytetrahydrobiopterin dehydratase
MDMQPPDGWEISDGALKKRYSFPDFATAMAFANRVAGAAEEADHHPDMLVTWGAVELTWVTHSEGGITDRDADMARRSDALLDA